MSNSLTWLPTQAIMDDANITHFMSARGFNDVAQFHQWTTQHYDIFWQDIINTLGIVFKKHPDAICDLRQGIEMPQWLPGASLNITDSCFKAPPSQTALHYWDENQTLCHMTYQALHTLSNQVANGLVALDIHPGDAVAIAMPMNPTAIAIYLGIIKMGGIVVSIADSFSPPEIATRLRIANVKMIFTQDQVSWMGKQLPLYTKITAANAPRAIVIPLTNASSTLARPEDACWDTFLSKNTSFTAIACSPMQTCHILFSSGTTADPKAIPWNHTTPIKVGSDAYFHHNIKSDDVLAWPTNLGWMMGPWLLFAGLLNNASIALYTEAPKERQFGEFIQQAGVTMLGVVPTLVAHWRQTQCMEGLDWSRIRLFSSTGECSNANDMSYLMSLANHKPIIEYCGGTEIGGAYITSTIVQPNIPATFSTPAMGIDFTILDEQGHPANVGEVAILPPSIGLSTTLLNSDHHQVYFENMPMVDGRHVRRHGDQMMRLENGYYCILGRADDTMNLGGIKISAAEIERAVIGIPDIAEVAAIAMTSSQSGPTQLVIYAVTSLALDKTVVLKTMQQRINTHLNPLFKIHDVVFVSELPKTASNKIMRRMLRDTPLGSVSR